MTFARSDRWRSSLAQYFERVRRQPFAYGQSDCACFAAGAIEAMTGVDPMAAWRGRYKSARGARKLIREAGAESLGDLLAQLFPEVHPAQARVGDLALLPGEGPIGEAIGVVAGERVLAMAAGGLDSRDRSEMTRAFLI